MDHRPNEGGIVCHMVSSGFILLVVTATVLATHFVGAITAFGSSMLAVPLLVLVLGAHQLEAIIFTLILVGSLQAMFIAVRTWRHINWRFLGYAGAGALPGLLIGIEFRLAMPSSLILQVLAFPCFTAGTWGLIQPQATSGREITLWLFGGASWLAGAVHGAFASGGGILVALAQYAISDKQQFRGTLSAFWLLINLLFVGQHVCRFASSWHLVVGAGALGIAVIAVTWLGDWVSRFINQRQFKAATSVVILLLGVVLFKR